ncbi:MAG: hypothetical protein OEO79_09160 [Gemmatimonadota bacterium]|nr:hypothetical protein [Gemmatimonadota bacterium]MDH3423156.1 hypothetical protein [Gemmatimonadota bacterium]
MRRTILILTLATSLSGVGLEAQVTARDRAQQALSPEMFRDLTSLADEMRTSGIPDEPIYVKALEGNAKRVPPDRLLPAVRAYAGRLGEARLAFGVDATTPLLVAGADALQRGVSPDQLRSLPTDRPRSPMAVMVLADLLESGVPADRALAILRDVMTQRARDDRMLDVSARVRRLIREGLTPQEAIDRVRRNLLRARDGSLGPPVPPGSEPVIRDRILDRVDGTDF